MMDIEEFKEKMKEKYHDDIDVRVLRDENGKPGIIAVWDEDKLLEEYLLENYTKES